MNRNRDFCNICCNALSVVDRPTLASKQAMGHHARPIELAHGVDRMDDEASRHFETARLRMRPIEAGDIDDLARLHGDPEIMAGMRFGAEFPEQVAGVLSGYLATWRDHGFGIWALLDKASGAYVGECGFWVRDDGEGIAMRAVLDKPFWGRELATEAASAALDYGFGVAGLDRVVGVSRASNARSRGAIEKIGFRLVRRWRKEDGVELMFYAISREEWLARAR